MRNWKLSEIRGSGRRRGERGGAEEDETERQRWKEKKEKERR
jgi:hypothetical protein